MADNEPAPEGQVWVCSACGKTSRVRWEFNSYGWDESCMLNAVLCYDDLPPGADPRVHGWRRVTR